MITDPLLLVLAAGQVAPSIIAAGFSIELLASFRKGKLENSLSMIFNNQAVFYKGFGILLVAISFLIIQYAYQFAGFLLDPVERMIVNEVTWLGFIMISSIFVWYFCTRLLRLPGGRHRILYVAAAAAITVVAIASASDAFIQGKYTAHELSPINMVGLVYTVFDFVLYCWFYASMKRNGELVTAFFFLNKTKAAIVLVSMGVYFIMLILHVIGRFLPWNPRPIRDVIFIAVLTTSVFSALAFLIFLVRVKGGGARAGA